MKHFVLSFVLLLPAVAFAQAPASPLAAEPPAPPLAPTAPPAPPAPQGSCQAPQHEVDIDIVEGPGHHPGAHSDARAHHDGRGDHRGIRMRKVTVIESHGDGDQQAYAGLAYPKRPNVFSIGIGVGYAMAPNGLTHADLSVINTTSVRARLASGLQFEAMFRAVADRETTDDGTGTATDRRTELAVGAQILVPVMTRHKTDLHAVGAAQLYTAKINPHGDDNATTTTGVGLGYGVEVQYWARRHVSLSMQATNALVDFERSSIEQSGGDEQKITDATYGLVWDPAIRLMFHVYF